MKERREEEILPNKQKKMNIIIQSKIWNGIGRSSFSKQLIK
jgi:hypothetical protein